jgi:uncharacterized membrane protein
VSAYAFVKTLHVLSSVLLVGTGFGSAFYLYMAHRCASVPVIAVVARLVVRADAWFTAPAALAQPLTGLWLARAGGWPLASAWILGTGALFLLAGACWLPVLRLQVRMARLARRCAGTGEELPAAYWSDARTWERLGYPAFGAMVLAYFLMVAKPSLS